MKRLTACVLGLSLWCLGVQSATTPQKVLFVGIGGHGSCGRSTDSNTPPLGISLAPGFQSTVSATRTRNRSLEVFTLLACLESEAPPDGELQYILSTQKQAHVGNLHDVKAALEAFLKKHPGITVYLTGHSYGAWSSMYLAENLQGQMDLRGLFTIDPIGPDCDVFGVVFGGSACHSAPTDRDNKAIKKRAKHWVNFYQDEDSWISSSEIAEAQNHHITFEWGPHGDIDAEKAVWKTIDETVRKSLTP